MILGWDQTLAVLSGGTAPALVPLPRARQEWLGRPGPGVQDRTRRKLLAVRFEVHPKIGAGLNLREPELLGQCEYGALGGG